MSDQPNTTVFRVIEPEAQRGLTFTYASNKPIGNPSAFAYVYPAMPTGTNPAPDISEWIVKESRSAAENPRFDAEYQLMQGLVNSLKSQGKTPITPNPIYLVERDGTHSLVMPKYTETMKDVLHYTKWSVNSEWLAVTELINYLELLKVLAEKHGSALTDRKIDDFFWHNDHMVVIDWNLLRGEEEKFRQAGLQLMVRLWYSLLTDRDIRFRLNPYNDADWRVLGQTDPDDLTPFSLGWRLILADVMSGKYTTHSALIHDLSKWQVALKSVVNQSDFAVAQKAMAMLWSPDVEKAVLEDLAARRNPQDDLARAGRKDTLLRLAAQVPALDKQKAILDQIGRSYQTGNYADVRASLGNLTGDDDIVQALRKRWDYLLVLPANLDRDLRGDMEKLRPELVKGAERLRFDLANDRQQDADTRTYSLEQVTDTLNRVQAVYSRGTVPDENHTALQVLQAEVALREAYQAYELDNENTDKIDRVLELADAVPYADLLIDHKELRDKSNELKEKANFSLQLDKVKKKLEESFQVVLKHRSPEPESAQSFLRLYQQRSDLLTKFHETDSSSDSAKMKQVVELVIDSEGRYWSPQVTEAKISTLLRDTAFLMNYPNATTALNNTRKANFARWLSILEKNSCDNAREFINGFYRFKKAITKEIAEEIGLTKSIKALQEKLEIYQDPPKYVEQIQSGEVKLDLSYNTIVQVLAPKLILHESEQREQLKRKLTDEQRRIEQIVANMEQEQENKQREFESIQSQRIDDLAKHVGIIRAAKYVTQDDFELYKQQQATPADTVQPDDDRAGEVQSDVLEPATIGEEDVSSPTTVDNLKGKLQSKDKGSKAKDNNRSELWVGIAAFLLAFAALGIGGWGVIQGRNSSSQLRVIETAALSTQQAQVLQTATANAQPSTPEPNIQQTVDAIVAPVVVSQGEMATQVQALQTENANLQVTIEAMSNVSDTESDAGTGDVGTGDAGVDDTGVGDTGVGDAGTGDAGVGDTGTGDAGTGDAGVGDAGTGDAGTGDAGTGDAGTGDASTDDTSTDDAGTGDAGTGDAGTGDAGVDDTGVGDTGVGDAGTGDAGTGDAGTGDASTEASAVDPNPTEEPTPLPALTMELPAGANALNPFALTDLGETTSGGVGTFVLTNEQVADYAEKFPYLRPFVQTQWINLEYYRVQPQSDEAYIVAVARTRVFFEGQTYEAQTLFLPLENQLLVVPPLNVRGEGLGELQLAFVVLSEEDRDIIQEYLNTNSILISAPDTDTIVPLYMIQDESSASSSIAAVLIDTNWLVTLDSGFASSPANPNLRSEPNITGEIVGNLQSNQPVEIISSNEWFDFATVFAANVSVESLMQNRIVHVDTEAVADINEWYLLRISPTEEGGQPIVGWAREDTINLSYALPETPFRLNSVPLPRIESQPEGQ